MAHRLIFHVAVGLLSTAWPSPAQAQTEQAAQHFDAALGLVERGELPAAVAEFERAYELSPHYSVLYNLGQVYARLGRYRDAVAAFERYMREGGNKIDMERRQRVHELIEQQRPKLATLQVDVTPDAAVVSVDAAIAKFDNEALLLDPKTHTLTVSLAGYETHEQSVELSPGEVKKLRITLQPQPQEFELVILCPLPDVVLEVAGESVRTLPGGLGQISQKVTAREPKIRFLRDGYAPQSLQLDPAFSRHRIACDLDPILDDEPSLATLNLSVSEPGAEVRVDGEPYRSQLVPGRHLVTVERSGFQRWARFVQLAAGETGSLYIRLNPTDGYKAEYERQAKQQRTYAYVLGAAGLVLGATGGALYAWGFERQGTYERRETHIRAPGKPEKGSTADRENRKLRESIVFYDRVALGLGVLSSVAFGGAIWFYVDSDDPDRYDPEGIWSVRASMSSLTVEHVF